MKVDSIDSLRLLNNYVLVKPDPGNSKITLRNGVVIFLDTSFEVERHAVTSGTVVKVPASLTYIENNGLLNLDVITTQELKKGDKVIFHYIQTLDNLKLSRYITCGRETYFLVYYDKIFCAIRRKKVIPVNGLVIVEAEKEPPIKSPFIIPDMFKGIESETRGVIKYIGSPVGGYSDYPDQGGDVDYLKVGDSVLFRKVDSVPLQYPLHQTIDKDKTLYRMHRRDILGKYDEIIAGIDKYNKKVA